MWLIVISLLLALQLQAQENHLTKQVSLIANGWPLGRVLTEMESQGHFFFSYDAEILSTDSILSIRVEKEKLELVLKRLLPPSVQCKSVGNHVVIFKPLNKSPSNIVISGYIRDGRSKQPIANVTLYSPQQNLMAATNAAGYYELTVSAEAQKMGLTLSKTGYRQEEVYVRPGLSTPLDFQLINLEKPLDNIPPRQLAYPDVNERKIVQLVVPDRIIENSQNLTLFERAAAQFSLVPGVGTNGLLNGNSTNRFSFNLLAGYSQGTDGVEIGSLVNINRKDMNGLQVAGIANLTGRFMHGLQLAGIFNYNGLLFEGAQVSGVTNLNLGDMKGVQVAGFSNILKGKMEGAQISGFANFTTQNVDGAQIAGFLNISAKDVKEAQVSGFMNYSQNIEGVQVAGFLNLAVKEVRSVQLSGFANYADRVEGGQVSGFTNITNHKNSGFQLSSFFNYSRDNEGFQLAFFNYSDTSSGVPFGFLSIVNKGYHSLEISADESFYGNLAYKTGVPLFYNILGAGLGPYDFYGSYGIGTMPVLGRKIKLSLDLTGNFVLNNTKPDWNNPRYLFRFMPALHYQPFKKLGIAAGPTLNFYYAEIPAEGGLPQFSSYSFYENTGGGYYRQAWIGGRLALRFF